MASICCENIVKNFNQVEVLKDINLDIRDGEFAVFVGPSGCGKTTLLRLIAGLEEISGGRILIGERLVNDVSPKERNIAMVFQNYAIYPHMTVAENIGFGMKMRGANRAEIDTAVKDAAQTLGLTELLERKPKQLSGGQRQRVAMGRAIVRNPAVFLMDEPLSNLDAELRNQMRVEIKSLQHRLGTTTIYVTHDQVEAMTLADRIAVLKDGEVQQFGTPRELFGQPSNMFVAGFIGTPRMNFFNATRISGEKLRLSAGVEVTIPKRHIKELAGRDSLFIGVRAEHISLAPREYASANAAQVCVDAVVNICEELGNEQIVHLVVEGADIQAKTRISENAIPGQSTRLIFDLANAHFFCASSGVSLSHPRRLDK